MPKRLSDGAVPRTEAPAKINWTLEVLGKRPDGYHEIRSVMQTLSLKDTLELHPADRFSLTVDGPQAANAGNADENFVTRAARSFPDLLERQPVAFRLTKRIPAAAGLGGGSSDAAAALRLLSDYWHIDDPKRLYEVAGALGSDVPFFLRGGVQLAAGRGEALVPLPSAELVSLVLLTPPLTLRAKRRSGSRNGSRPGSHRAKSITTTCLTAWPIESSFNWTTTGRCWSASPGRGRCWPERGRRSLLGASNRVSTHGSFGNKDCARGRCPPRTA
jgi:4-diphosphocytidyl-2-C-methyl-D-erythritol kinase